MPLNGVGDWGVNGPTDQPPDPSIPGSQVPASFGPMSPQETLSWVYDPTRNPGMRYDPSRGLMWQWAPPVEGGTKYIRMEGELVPYQEEATPGRWVSFSGSPAMAQGAITSYNQYSTPDPGLADWGTVAAGLGTIAGMGALGGAFSGVSPLTSTATAAAPTTAATTAATTAPSITSTIANAINPSAIAQGAVQGAVKNAIVSAITGGTPNPLTAATMGAVGAASGGIGNATGISPSVVNAAISTAINGGDLTKTAANIAGNAAMGTVKQILPDGSVFYSAPSLENQRSDVSYMYSMGDPNQDSTSTSNGDNSVSDYNFTFDDSGNLIDSETGQPVDYNNNNQDFTYTDPETGKTFVRDVNGELVYTDDNGNTFTLENNGQILNEDGDAIQWDANGNVVPAIGTGTPPPGGSDTSGGGGAGGSSSSGGGGSSTGGGGGPGGGGASDRPDSSWWRGVTQNNPWLAPLIASMVAASNNKPAPITQTQNTSSTTGARTQDTTSTTGPSTQTGTTTTGPSTQTGTTTTGPSTQTGVNTSGPSMVSTNQTVGPQTTITSPTTLLPDLANTSTLNAAIQAAISPIRQNFFDPGGTLSQIRTDFGDQYGSTRHQIAEAVAASREQQNELNTAATIANALYGTNLTYELNRGIANQGKATTSSGVSTTGTTANSGQTNTSNLFNSGTTTSSNQTNSGQTTTANQTNSGQTNTSSSNFSPVTTTGSTSSNTQLPATPWWQSGIGAALATQSLINAINNPTNTVRR